MLNVRWTMILRELWTYRSRTLLVVLAVAVGVMAFGIMSSAQVVVASNVKQTYRDSNPAHSTLVVSDFDGDLLDAVRQMPGVGQAEARRAVAVKVVAAPDQWITFEIQALADPDIPDIRRLSPGRDALLPPPRGQILLERSAQYLFDVGETLVIRMADGATHPLRVAGYANDVNLIPSHIIPVGYGYVSLPTAPPSSVRSPAWKIGSKTTATRSTAPSSPKSARIPWQARSTRRCCCWARWGCCAWA